MARFALAQTRLYTCYLRRAASNDVMRVYGGVTGATGRGGGRATLEWCTCPMVCTVLYDATDVGRAYTPAAY